MSTIVDPPRPLSAGQRTALLYRMLVVRHFAEHHAPVPSPNPDDAEVIFHLGEEATAAGVLTALRPGDAMMDSTGPRAFDLARNDLRAQRATVTVCLHQGDAPDWLSRAERAHLPLLCLRDDPDEPVDGLDVEAVLPRISEGLRVIRAGAGPCLLSLRIDGPADPVETLVVRMRAAHQLDDNALRAINAAALVQVAAALSAGCGRSAKR
jgi:hypothetical protein